MRCIVCAMSALAWALCAYAEPEVVASAPQSIEVVIYRDTAAYDFYDDLETELIAEDDELSGLAMIVETRTADLPIGTSTLVFPGVAEGIVPQSARVEGLPGLPLESNFDYDLLSPAAVLAGSLDRPVIVVRTDAATGRETRRQALLKTGPQGVLLDFGDAVEALDCSGLGERLIFAEIPAALSAAPTLSMRVRSDAAGRHTVKLAYLAMGMRWRAAYVATLNEDGKTLHLNGWLTLTNMMATSFEHARTHVLAGNLLWDGEQTRPPEPMRQFETSECWPIGSFAKRIGEIDSITAEDIGRFPDANVSEALQRLSGVETEEIVVTGIRASIADETELGDYKLYTLPGRTTVAAQQAKQVMLLDQREVSYERIYRYTVDHDELGDGFDDPEPPRVLLKLKNEKRDGLGKALPRGRVAVVQDGVLAGENDILDIPVGSPLEIRFAEAIDVRGEAHILDRKRIERRAERRDRVRVEVLLANDKPQPIVMEVQHTTYDPAPPRILRSSKAYTLKDGEPLWRFELPPGGGERLVYTIEVVE